MCFVYQTCLGQPPLPIIEPDKTLCQQKEQTDNQTITENDASQQAKEDECSHQNPDQLELAGFSQSRISSQSGTPIQLPQNFVHDQGPPLFYGQPKQRNYSTPNLSQQVPVNQWNASNSDPRQLSSQQWPYPDEYGHAHKASKGDGSGLGSLKQNPAPGSKKKREPLVAFNSSALKDMKDSILDKAGFNKALDKAVEKRKLLWKQR
ncbi:hypothetical protein CDD82_3132 [Ophiocordyceps australis]|uniref:Uncharacterized protein n=1 Tax=Ophiocordyceps australis TaxID=1399860 RepID=A0A2C5ZQ40_9HYPO|nr:hypothetical protein CDD82_3132 [Ophiocordyceps australis]